MKLNEKIILCRKKQGLSQGDLAVLLNISRQSVSKWETGEANPDIDKLKTLGKVFEVSIDWLLDESEDEEDVNVNNVFPEWINKLPKSVISMIKKYGWIYGVYASIGGFIFIGFGIFVRVLAKHFIMGNIDFYDYVDSSSLQMFTLFSNVIIFIGVADVIFNFVIVVALKNVEQ